MEGVLSKGVLSEGVLSGWGFVCAPLNLGYLAWAKQVLICVNITKQGLNNLTLALLTLSRNFSFLDNHVQYITIYHNICYKILAVIY